FLLLPWRSLSDCYFFSLPQLARLCSKLVCYFSNCLQYREGAACFLPEDVDPSPCTHLIRAFAGMDSHQLSSIEWNEETLYKEFHGLQKMNPKLKTLLAFGGWSFGTQNPSSDKQHFTALVQQEAQTSRKACLLLSSVTPAGRHDEEAGHEVDKIALSLRQMARTMNLDSHRLMAHDLHGSWEKAPGHDSSLHKRRGECRVMDRLKVVLESLVEVWVDSGLPQDESWWRVLTSCGLQEKGMANHFRILVEYLELNICNSILYPNTNAKEAEVKQG
ncbi:hypothetical protein FD754_019612, partial [Muntiacus muntjak]